MDYLKDSMDYLKDSMDYLKDSTDHLKDSMEHLKDSMEPTDHVMDSMVYGPTITTGTLTFHCRTYDTPLKVNLYLGSDVKWCVHVELNRDRESKQIKPRAYLIKIRYDALCTATKNMKRGEDTTTIMRVILHYLSLTYPTVTHLHFNDLSKRSCDNRSEVSLSVLYYLYRGETWYMNRFGAIVDPEEESIWNVYVQRLARAKQEPWEVIRATLFQAQLPSVPMTPDEMGALYQEASTWQDFFQAVIARITIRSFCIFMNQWEDSFVKKYFNNLIGIGFLIPVVPQGIDYHASPLVEGGGRRRTRQLTRRRRRSPSRTQKDHDYHDE